MNLQIIKTQFKELKNNSKIIRVISSISILLSFITFFLISIFNNGLTFINPNRIVSETLLKTLVGVSTGFSLAVSGAAMQAVTRNELSGPTTLGFLPAATLGILVYQIIDFQSIPIMILLAFAFSIVILIINFLSCKIAKNDIKGYKVILVGIILGALVSSISIIMTTLIPELNQNIIPWIGESNLSFDWEKIKYTLPIMIVGSTTIFLLSNKLNIVERDPFLAKSLGINVDFIYWFAGISSVFITVSSVILIGSLTMIGVIVPHLIRMLFKTKDYKIITPMSGILCSTFIMFSLFINSKWSIGLNFFTTLISSPIFIYLIIRRKDNQNDN